MKILKVFANQYFWLALIILFGLLVRLYKLDSPIADWHSWRQADTASVTRNFIKFGFNPFFPKYDDMSGVSEQPIINPAGFRFVEFPVYNILVYPLFLLFGIDDRFHRLVSIIFSLGSTVFIFFIAKKYINPAVGLLSAFAFAFLPFNVFFSRTVLPEPTFVFFSLGMVYFVDRWINKEKKSDLLAGLLFTGISFLIKPWAIFFFLPLLYLVHIKRQKKFWIKFILFSIISILPFLFWRLWILQQPQGIPASGWLLNGDGIRFRPAFWKWILSERLGGEILGVTGFFLLFIGLLTRPQNGKYFFHIWAVSSFLFMVIFATGNVRHNYYQISFIPIAVIFLAKGFMDLIRGGISYIARIWTILIALLFFLLSFYLTWDKVKGFYQINNPAIVEAGKAADKILPKDAKVLAPYNGDTAFLYQINRQGFAVEALPIMELVSDYGINYYISTTKDDKTNWVIRQFTVLVDNPDFVIVDLTKLKKP